MFNVIFVSCLLHFNYATDRSTWREQTVATHSMTMMIDDGGLHCTLNPKTV